MGSIKTFEAFLKSKDSVKEHNIIHFHGRISSLLPMIYLKKFELQKFLKIIYTLHDDVVIPKEYSIVKRLVYFAELHGFRFPVVRSADKIITVSPFVAERLKKLGIESDRVKFIPNGVDVHRFRPSKKRKIILFVGRLTKRKNVSALIQAFSQINRRNYKLVIIGDGEERLKLINMIKRERLTGEVLLLGNVSKKMLTNLYSISAIFALPSLSEGFPLSILEAMASGCAIVASNIPTMQSIVRSERDNFAILIKPKDTDSIAQALSELITNSNLRRKLSLNARNVCMSKFSWEIIAKKILNTYLSVLGMQATS